MLPTRLQVLAQRMARHGWTTPGYPQEGADHESEEGQEALLRAMPPAVRPALHRVVDAIPPLSHARQARRLRHRMRAALGYEPDFRRPRTFNERVAHRILHDRNPLIPLTTDKVTARDYVAAYEREQTERPVQISAAS